MNYGKELLKILKLQRNTFERLADGNKRIFNPVGYYKFEEESERLQGLIGRENKNSILTS